MLHMTLTAAVLQLLSWLNDHGDALHSACQLLGGASRASRTARLLEDLRANPQITERVRRELRILHGLLALEHVHDPDREEHGFFAEIDPADPVVYEICALTDGLEGHLAACDAEHQPQAPARPRAA
jgi:hypothetical protein